MRTVKVELPDERKELVVVVVRRQNLLEHKDLQGGAEVRKRRAEEVLIFFSSVPSDNPRQKFERMCLSFYLHSSTASPRDYFSKRSLARKPYPKRRVVRTRWLRLVISLTCSALGS